MSPLTGSSPRVRGAVALDGGEVGAVGIIPACAGSSFHCSITHNFNWDHPRVCGEQSAPHELDAGSPGSSPRVRGAGGVDLLRVSAEGIIPACAGSSSLGAGSAFATRDHPRVCGEQLEEFTKYGDDRGSSPRVRGAACQGMPHIIPVGIIPACAGSRRVEVRGPWRTEDHPRVCGEQSLVHPAEPREAGSSPRVRGAGEADHVGAGGHGIIPACAGSSC